MFLRGERRPRTPDINNTVMRVSAGAPDRITAKDDPAGFVPQLTQWATAETIA